MTPLINQITTETASRNETIARREAKAAEGQASRTAAIAAARAEIATAQARYDETGADADRDALTAAETALAKTVQRHERLSSQERQSIADARASAKAAIEGLRKGYTDHVLDSVLEAAVEVETAKIRANVEAAAAGCTTLPEEPFNRKVDNLTREGLTDIFQWLAWQGAVHRKVGRAIARANEADAAARHDLLRQKTQKILSGTREWAYTAGAGPDADQVRARLGKDRESELLAGSEIFASVESWYSAETARLRAKHEAELLRIQASAGIAPPSSPMPENLDSWRRVLRVPLPPIDPAPEEDGSLVPSLPADPREQAHAVARDLTPANAGVWRA